MTRAGESPGVVDLGGWVALGDQKPRESVHDGARLLGSYSGAEPSLREMRFVRIGRASPRCEYREVVSNYAAGALTDTALGRGGYSERQANRMRGVRRIAIGSRNLEKSFKL